VRACSKTTPEAGAEAEGRYREGETTRRRKHLPEGARRGPGERWLEVRSFQEASRCWGSFQEGAGLLEWPSGVAGRGPQTQIWGRGAAL